MKKILYILLLFPLASFGQKWIFSEGGNPFDGSYRAAQVAASNGEFPYHESKLVINLFNNDRVNLYITDAGYFQSISELKILWVFDIEPNVIYDSRCSGLSDDGKTVFFDGIYTSSPFNEYDKFDFIEKLKTSTKVSVRLKNGYGKNDVNYTLNGSVSAIDSVFKNFNFIENPINIDTNEVDNFNHKKPRVKVVKEEIDAITIIPNSLLHMFNAFALDSEGDTVFAFGYPIIGQVNKEYIYFSSYSSFNQFTEDINVLFSGEYDSNDTALEITDDKYKLTLNPSKGAAKSIIITTNDGVESELFRWSFIKKMKPKIDEFKLEYFSKTVKEASFSDSLEHHFNDEFIITEITYSTLMSNLKNGNEISITYRKRKSSEIFIGVGVLKTIAHNRIEYYDKEQLEINAINFSYINSIKIISR